jgi:hypothetical protein
MFRPRISSLILALAATGCVSPMQPPLPTELREAVVDPANAKPEMANLAKEDDSAATAMVKRVPPLSPSARRRSIPAPGPVPGVAPPLPSNLADQPIEELVIRPTTMTGFWTLTASHSIDVDIGLFSGIQIRYGGELRDRNICWAQQRGHSLTLQCSSGSAMKIAEGSVDDDGITVRWWAGPATIIFAGKFTESGKISGGFSGGVVGLSVTGNVPASLTKLTPAAPSDAPDRPSAVLLRDVWDDVRSGQWTPGRYEGTAIKRVTDGLSRESAANPPLSYLYLGRILIRWRKEQREMDEDVYLLETAQGRQLCRIASNEQGQVMDFNCGTLAQ